MRSAEHARSDGSLQIAINCSNNPNIRSDGSSSTDTFEFTFLQNTQESGLYLNSALKCGSSKSMPFEAGATSRVDNSLGPMPPPLCWRVRGHVVRCQSPW